MRGEWNTAPGRDPIPDPGRVRSQGQGRVRSLAAVNQQEMPRGSHGTMARFLPYHINDRVYPIHHAEHEQGRHEMLPPQGGHRAIQYNQPVQFGYGMNDRDSHHIDNFRIRPRFDRPADVSRERRICGGAKKKDATSGMSHEMALCQGSVSKKKPSKSSRRGRKKFTVDPGVLGDRAIELLGQRNKAEAEQFICTMSRIQLHRAFEMLYDTPTGSSNNSWLRNKILQAIKSDAEYQHGTLVYKEKEDVPKQPRSEQQEGPIGSEGQIFGLVMDSRRRAIAEEFSDIAGTNTRHNPPSLSSSLEREETWDNDCNHAGGPYSTSRSDPQGVAGQDSAIDGKYPCVEQSSSRWHLPVFHGHQMDTRTHGGAPVPHASNNARLSQVQPPVQPQMQPQVQPPVQPQVQPPVQMNDRYGMPFCHIQGMHPPAEALPMPYVEGPQNHMIANQMNNMQGSNVSLQTLHQLSSIMNSMEKQFYTTSIQQSLQRIKSTDYEMYRKIVGEVPELPPAQQDQRNAGVQVHNNGMHNANMVYTPQTMPRSQASTAPSHQQTLEPPPSFERNRPQRLSTPTRMPHRSNEYHPAE